MSKPNRPAGDGLDKLAGESNRPTLINRSEPAGDTKLESGTPLDEGTIRNPETIAGFPAVSPFALDGAPGSGTDGPGGGDRSKRGRGRPRKDGAQRTTAAEKVSQNLSGIANIERLLTTLCFFTGNLCSAPELYIEEKEAQECAEALRELAKHYPVPITEKGLAWVNVTLTFGGVGARMAMAISSRPKLRGPELVVQPIRKTGAGEPGTMTAPPVVTSGHIGGGLPRSPADLWDGPPIEDISG